MRDPQSCESPTGRDALSMQAMALRYAAGAMPSHDAEAFEVLLATDQTVRDALAEAVRLSAAVLGQPVPRPGRSVQEFVRERLFAHGFSSWVARRMYRGHPAAWAGLGAAVVAVSSVAVLQFSERAPVSGTAAPVAVPPLPVVAARPAHVPPASAPSAADASSMVVDKEPAEPTTELTAKMGPTIHIEKAVEDDGKWKR